VQAATPTVALLNKFAQPTPELAQNLAMVLADLDNRGRAVEPDPRSPGGQGFTGLEALLQYAFNQSMAINTFGQFGHLLAVDAFQSGMCSPYASPGTIAANLKQYGPAYRQCYSWLGPNQPGTNETDPSNPNGCVPDPGGAPPGETGPKTTARACPANPLSPLPSSGSSPSPTSSGSGAGLPLPLQSTPPTANRPTPGVTTPKLPTPTVSTPTVSTPTLSTPTVSVPTITTPTTPSVPGVPGTSSSSSSGTPSAQQAQQLLNYLLAP
jgi:hypothetical protein